MKHRVTAILTELKGHAPFTLFGAFTGLVCMMLFKNLDHEISKRLFYVFHPAFGHFAEAYGLNQKAVERGGREPSARELQELIAEARTDGARAVFVQPQHGTGSAETIAKAIGADLVTLDPLARDVLANLETIGTRIEQALKP